MALDVAQNFAEGTLASGIDADDTSLTLLSGEGARFGAVPFNAVIWNVTDFQNSADAFWAGEAEIVRVTNISTDTLTITRAQESTTAVTHNTGGKTYRLAAGGTAKIINDIRFFVNKITGDDTDIFLDTGAAGSFKVGDLNGLANGFTFKIQNDKFTLTDPNGDIDFAGGSISKYLGVGTTGFGVAPIRGQISLTGQATDLTNEILVDHTTMVGGVIRVSIFVEVVTPPTTGTLGVTVTFTDDKGERAATNGELGSPPNINIAAAGSTFRTQGTMVIRSHEAHDVTVSVALTGVTGSVEYAIYATAEYLTQ